MTSVGDSSAGTQIERVDPAVDTRIEPFLATVHGRHRELDAWVRTAECVYIATSADEIVGLAARTGSRLHPTRDWISVHVQVRHRERGIGKALLDNLRAERADVSTKVRVPSAELTGLRFAARHGYDRAVLSANVRLRDLPPPPALGSLTTNEVAHTDSQFLAALEALYVVTHRWDPCSGFGPGEVQQLLAGQDVIPGSARTVSRGDEIVGVGLAYEGTEQSTVEMANFGAVDPADGAASEIAHIVLDAVGRRFLDAGEEIIVECDFGPGANTPVARLLEEVAEPVVDTVEILFDGPPSSRN